MDKVFCIGVWKTGTTSVGQACNHLIGGYHNGNTGEPPGDLDYEKKVKWYLMGYKYHLDKLHAPYSTFDDDPWNRLEIITLLHKFYPHYKYVLTTRDPDQWHYSAYNFYKKLLKNEEVDFGYLFELYDSEFKFMLGDDFDTSSMFDKDLEGMIKYKSKWLDWFQSRNDYVKNLFSSSQLLEYNISDKLGWEPLCNFLDKPIPKKSFPNLNKS